VQDEQVGGRPVGEAAQVADVEQAQRVAEVALDVREHRRELLAR
jgi:hypothetical protein